MSDITREQIRSWLKESLAFHEEQSSLPEAHQNYRAGHNVPIAALKWALDAQEQQGDYDRAMSYVRANGVPELRTKYLSTGIDVIVTRQRKYIDALEQQLRTARSDALEDEKRRINDLVCGLMTSARSDKELGAMSDVLNAAWPEDAPAPEDLAP